LCREKKEPGKRIRRELEQQEPSKRMMEDSNSKVTSRIGEYVKKTKERRGASNRNECRDYRTEWERLVRM
jgi:hypothetical protein